MTSLYNHVWKSNRILLQLIIKVTHAIVGNKYRKQVYSGFFTFKLSCTTEFRQIYYSNTSLGRRELYNTRWMLYVTRYTKCQGNWNDMNKMWVYLHVRWEMISDFIFVEVYSFLMNKEECLFCEGWKQCSIKTKWTWHENWVVHMFLLSPKSQIISSWSYRKSKLLHSQKKEEFI